MNPVFKREVAQHIAFALCFLFGLFTADRILGERAPEGVDVHRFYNRNSDNGVSARAMPQLQPQPATHARRVTSAKPAINPVSFFESGWSSGLNLPLVAPARLTDDSADDENLLESKRQQVRQIELSRIATIEKVTPAVVCIFGLEKQGGGSGVLIHPSGLALTNHHVVAACGIEGWGGLADGKLYRWRLVGNDPGGDLALIQLQGMDTFPFVRLGDSYKVQVGDWTLVMGNPFTLAEDYTPTVTHGIVSGIHRYQPGMADVLLVYGDCIQTDTSINPGNSGGPLFDMQGNLIGINGRASFDFKTRGRVNVGLGYAISVNQCRNFLPELMATKLVQHGTLDAVFQDREGKVLCAALYEDSQVGELGMALGDELLEFENRAIHSANQFTNLICTLPAGWPVRLKMRRGDGTEYEICSRLLGLPYPKTAEAAVDPAPPKKEDQPDGAPEEQPNNDPNNEDPNNNDPNDAAPKSEETPKMEKGMSPLQQEIARSKFELNRFLAGRPGVPQFPELHQQMTSIWLKRWAERIARDKTSKALDVLQPEQIWQVIESIQLENGPELELTVYCNPALDRWEMHVKSKDGQMIAQPNRDWDVHLRKTENGWQRFANDGQWENISEDDLWSSTLGTQMFWIRNQIQPALEANSQWQIDGVGIDGVGKVNNQLAARMKIATAESQSASYFWLRLDDWQSESNVQLLQSSEDEDGRYNLGATQYDRWDFLKCGYWPVERTVTFGLFQEARAKIRTESCEPVAAAVLDENQ